MTTHRLISGDKIVEALLEAGICDNKTRGITLTANVGEPVTLEIRKYGDDRLLQIAKDGGIVITHDEKEAIAK